MASGQTVVFMDFSLTEEQRLLLDSVDRFMEQHLPSSEVRRRDAAAEPPYFLLPLMGDMGLLGLATPAEVGGGGSDWQTLALVQERLGYHATMAALLLNRVACFGIQTLLSSGSASQRERYLPTLLSGEGSFALALTEAGAGIDAGAVITRAHPESDGWRVNGRKIWISGAEAATRMVVACRTGEQKSGSGGISLLMIPPDAEGVSMTPLEKVGNRCSLTWEVAFDEVFVPTDELLGDVGEGFRALRSTLFYARTGLAAAVTGTAQACVDLAAEHARDRVQFGRPISQFQSIRHRLARMQTQVDQARLLTYRLAWMIDSGAPCEREAAMAKWATTEALKQVTDEGMQIMASRGYSSDSDMQRYWRDARLYTFGEGSSEIQLDLIGRSMNL
jgi:alkylation response protein AidB-like acyl-CoA dehydrogenase